MPASMLGTMNTNIGEMQKSVMLLFRDSQSRDSHPKGSNGISFYKSSEFPLAKRREIWITPLQIFRLHQELTVLGSEKGTVEQSCILQLFSAKNNKYH